MVDVGDRCPPYSQLISQLFSATRSATHFADLQTFYFHNCVYGRVYETERFAEPIWLHDLFARYDSPVPTRDGRRCPHGRLRIAHA